MFESITGTIVEVKKLNFIYPLNGTEHAYDIAIFKVEGAESTIESTVEIAVPSEGSQIYVDFTKDDKSKGQMVKDLSKVGANLMLVVRHEDLRAYFRAKQDDSPLAVLYATSIREAKVRF